jgi:hypothetical protein
MRLTALVDTGLPPGIERAVFLSPFNNEAKGHTKRMDENTNQMVPRNKH